MPIYIEGHKNYKKKIFNGQLLELNQFKWFINIQIDYHYNFLWLFYFNF
jgi:hypothetical protein